MQIRNVVTHLALLISPILLAAAPSRAVSVSVEIFAGGSSVAVFGASELGCTDTSAITATCSATGLTAGGLQIDSIFLDLDTDPVVSADALVTNVGAANNFTMIVTLPVAPIPLGTLTRGTAAGGVQDLVSGDGATLQTIPGFGFYTALIDGVPYQTLYPHPTSISALPFDANNLPDTGFGGPIPSQPGPAIIANIGIRYDFNLSGPGDAASFGGTFELVPIPEPGVALLLGLGLVALAGVRRRR